MRKKQLPIRDKDYIDLMAELEKTKNALESAYSVFENVTEPDLIDCSIYQINAIQLRYKFLLERAKQYGHDTAGEAAPIHTAADNIIYKYSELVL